MTAMLSKKVVVIGAGAAGMMAAGTAASLGASVTLIEKNTRVGRKLMITGKGRCNVLNNCDVPAFIANVPVNGRFLYSAINSFTPADTYDFFESIGVPLKTERGNRSYPQSDKAVDIVDALRCYVLENGIQGVGFYRAGSYVVPAHNAYMQVEATDEYILTGNFDGLDAIKMNESNSIEAVYNLGGQKINGSQKGISIVRMSDGTIKKVVIVK